jgi:hypothetical protein
MRWPKASLVSFIVVFGISAPASAGIPQGRYTIGTR